MFSSRFLPPPDSTGDIVLRHAATIELKLFKCASGRVALQYELRGTFGNPFDDEDADAGDVHADVATAGGVRFTDEPQPLEIALRLISAMQRGGAK